MRRCKICLRLRLTGMQVWFAAHFLHSYCIFPWRYTMPVDYSIMAAEVYGHGISPRKDAVAIKKRGSEPDLHAGG